KQNSLSILPVPFECRTYYRQQSPVEIKKSLQMATKGPKDIFLLLLYRLNLNLPQHASYEPTQEQPRKER
ncbi:MAG TPA: hypothetical protein VGK21_18990, partial [Candidatus Angelobacter sp.]